MYRRFKVFLLFQKIRCQLKLLRRNGVQDNVGTGNGIRGSHHTKLKLVSGKGKGRGTISIRIISCHIRKRTHTGIDMLSLFGFCSIACSDELGYHLFQLATQKAGNNSRRRLISPKSMVISHICRRHPKQIRMVVHSS